MLHKRIWAECIERPADAFGAGANRENGGIRNSRAGSRLPLPPDNVVSLLARAHGMRDADDVPHVVNEALRLLGGSQREGLRNVFFPRLAQLGEQIGVVLSMMEVKSMREDLEADGEVRLMVEERLQASLDKMKAQSYQEGYKESYQKSYKESYQKGYKESYQESYKEGFEQGLELGRQEVHEEIREEKLDLVRRITAWRFGADTARRLDPLLVGIKDRELLSSVCDRIMDCTTGPELLARLRHSD